MFASIVQFDSFEGVVKVTDVKRGEEREGAKPLFILNLIFLSSARV